MYPKNTRNSNSKMTIIWRMLVVVTLACSGCKKGIHTNEYNVQYEVIISKSSTARHLFVVFNIKNTSTYTVMNVSTPYKARTGPVKKGFKAWIGVSNDDLADSTLRLAVKISVSKNGGPFEVKIVDENNAPSETWEASYTINN
jgi:hypothetical protein